MSRSLPDFGEGVELPWPRAGDELFAPADDLRLSAHLGALRGESYTIGYKAAGDILVEHIMRHEIEADTLVFPIVFCYRQYLELLLKDVLADARRYYDINDSVPCQGRSKTGPLLPVENWATRFMSRSRSGWH